MLFSRNFNLDYSISPLTQLENKEAIMNNLENADPEYIELFETINCIPAGIYKVAEYHDDHIQLFVSTNIRVGIIGELERYLAPVPKEYALNNIIQADDFLDKYYSLLHSIKGSIPDFSKPTTFCALDPSVAREFV